MGLKDEARRPGLAALLLTDSPRDRDNPVTALDAQRLTSDLQAAVQYVVGGGGVGGPAAAAAAPPLVSEGRIDYAAVAQHVQQAVQTAGRPAAAEPAAPQEQQEQAGGQPPAADLAADSALQARQGQQPGEDVPASSTIPGGDAGASSSGNGGSAAADEEQRGRGRSSREGSGSSQGVSESPGRLPPLLEDSFGSSPASSEAVDPALAAPQTPAAAAAASESGSRVRLGPATVSLVEARGTCEIQGCCAMSRTNFATVRSNACVFRGRWQYEVQLGSAGIMQLGWTTLAARFNSEEGVGDTHDSYAYDGRRCMRWHVSNQPYGEHWAGGDVIGCCIDLDAGSVRFYRNGKDLGEAFTNVRRGMPGVAYFAGVSLSYSERCEVNFGGRPFLHPVEGYQPLEQQEPEPGQQQQQAGAAAAATAAPGSRQQQLAAARYLAGCLARLIDVSAPAPTAPEAGAAAGAVTEAEPGNGGGAGSSSEGYGGSVESAEHEEVEDALPPGQEFLIPAAASLPPSGARLPDADLLAALAAAAGEPGSSKAAAAAGSGDGVGKSSHAAGPAIRIDDRVLLGAVLAQHLGPLCFDPYAVEAVLLPLLDDTAGELRGGSRRSSASGGVPHIAAEPAAAAAADASAAEGGAPAASAAAAGTGASISSSCGGDGDDSLELGRQRLGQLLELLGAVLEPEEVQALATHCCQVLSRRVRGCQWDLQELPGSAALSALRLWSAVLGCSAFREAWLASGVWQQQLEGLLAVRQPSEEDLEMLFRNLRVTWGVGGAVVRSRRQDQSVFTDDLGKITEGMEQVEAAQADLLLQLWLDPSSTSTASSSHEQEGQQARQAGQHAGQEEQATAAASPASAAAAAPSEEHEEELGEQQQQDRPHQQQQEGQQQQQQESQQEQPQQQEEAQRGHYLRQFLQRLVDKNHGALRHIPPPGLSDQTTLVSAAFALLRLMNEQVSASLPDVPVLRWDPATTFLQGAALGGSDDPYWDAGRVGGTLSHLAREHPPTEEERQPLEVLPVGAVINYDAPLRLGARTIEGPSFADVWLRDRLLVLCHLAVAPVMRGSLNHIASMQAALAGLRAVSSEAGGRMMDETRRRCQQEFSRSLRSHEWAQCWVLSPWRQQAAFVLAVGTAQLLEAVSQQRRGLLRYVPELYISTPLDMLQAIHRCEPAVLDHAAMLSLGLRHIVKFVVCHLEDERIVSPEVQSRLLHMVLDGVQELDLLRELGSNAASRSRLVPAMMRLFGRPQLWGPVSNFFALLVEGSGFLHPPPAFPREFEEPLGSLRQLFRSACLSDSDLCARFTHHLFDNANRMLTELVASLEGMEASWSRGAGPSPQLLRLLSSTADYALVLLRVVELMAVEMPQLFLDGSDMNLTRLAEVVGFAVPQFVCGRAHRALQRVAADRLAAQLRLREAHLLQPLAGALVALWQAEQERAEVHKEQQQREQQQREQQRAETTAAGEPAAEVEQQDAAPPSPRQQQQQQQQQRRQQPPARRRQSLAQALERQPALTDEVLRGLLDVELSQVGPLSAEAALAAQEAGGASPTAYRRSNEQQLEALRGVVDGLLLHRAAAAAAEAERGAGGGVGAGGQHGSAGGAELAEAPEEYLDPILMTLMQDPVLLPDSRVCLDRATIERHLLSSGTDPFSRAPLSKEQLIPNTELRLQIEAWAEQHERSSNGAGS